MSNIVLTLVILTAFLAIVGIVGSLLWRIPKKQVSAKGVDAKELLTLENASRAALAQSIATIAQIVGGLGLLIGLYFTSQSLYTTQQSAASNLKQAEATLSLSQEARLNELFTRAIDQLGNQEIHVRVGAIFALERIARESPKDYKAIVELLAAYIRDRSPRKQESESLRGADDDEPVEKMRRPTSDIQAACAVIGRRSLGFNNGEDQRLDLRLTDLRGADLRKANLDGVLLDGANLEHADLSEVSLKEASLVRVNFRRAVMAKAHLEAAYLQDADLEEAKVMGAYITETRFHGANLQKANFSQAKGATRSQFEVASSDRDTILPEEFRED